MSNARESRRRKAKATKNLQKWRDGASRRRTQAALKANRERYEADVRRRREERYAALREEQLRTCPMEEHIKAQSIPDLRELQRSWFETLRQDPYGHVWFQHYDPRPFIDADTFPKAPTCVTKSITEALQFLSEELERRMRGSLRW